LGLALAQVPRRRIVIEALEKPAVYVPVDISEKQLRKSLRFFEDFFQRYRPGLNSGLFERFNDNPRLGTCASAKPNQFDIGPICAAISNDGDQNSISVRVT